jgi:hypothetical protein
MEEVRFYPGSDKGPQPEDDIETYSRWFFENQPPSTKDKNGTPLFNQPGLRKRFIQMSRDETERMETKYVTDYYIANDELHPMTNYEGQPEFCLD